MALVGTVRNNEKRKFRLSFIYFRVYIPEVERLQELKLQIIQNYNKTKNGIDMTDKILGEYTIKCLTERCPLVFF